MTMLSVRLLGGYQVQVGGETIRNFGTDKARALFAYLIVEAGRPHRREALAGLLWPERPDTVARTNLRQALARVQRALAGHGSAPLLFVSATDIQFNMAADYRLDVAELETFAAEDTHHRQLLPAALCADFLDGFALPDSEAFEAWMLGRQEHYHRLAMETLESQSADFEASGDYVLAAAAARLQLQLEPWLEEAHRRCMRALALAGRRDEALHQYETCRRALQAELGVEPATNTHALYADILAENVKPGQVSHSASPTSHVRPAGIVEPSVHRPGRLVAREDELGQLSRHLQAALGGETRVAFVMGDAGSGKSMLLEVFATSAMIGHGDLLVAGARCSPGGGSDPLAPLRKITEMLCGDLASDAAWRLPSEHQLDRLQRATNTVLAALAEQGPGLIDTLVPAASLARRARTSVARTAAELPAAWAAQAAPPARATLFDQLICTLAAVARTQPLLLLFDDLQWVDEATAAFLARIGRELEGSRLLILGAFRPAAVELGRGSAGNGPPETRRHPLAAVINELRRSGGEITLDLDRADGRTFVEAIVDTEPNRLGARFRDALYMQTGGHALFTVELLRSLRERGEIFKDAAGRWSAPPKLDWGPLPARVDGAIAERIDRLPAIYRHILDCASVQGDDFSAEATAELAGLAATDVLAILSNDLARRHHLVRPEGLQWLRSGQRSVYRFTHHLFQKYLYDQLDVVERALLHAQYAAALEQQVKGDQAERERISATLAWHYEAGGRPLQAARALYDAGRLAMRVSAFPDALNRYEHALALLADTAPSPERTELELLLQVAQLGPRRSAEGMAGAGLAGMLARISEAGVDQAQGWTKLMALETQVERLVAQGQLEAGLAMAAAMQVEAVQAGDDAFAAVADWQFGFINNLMGRPQAAEHYLARVLTWLTPERQTELRATLGTDIATPALCFSALDLWLLGFPIQAQARSASAVTSAREQEDIFGLATACALGAVVQFFLRDDDTALQSRAELCHRLSVEHGFTMWQLYAEVFLGRQAIMAGEEEAGLKQMRGALAGWQALGMTIGTDSLVLVLVDGCLAAAQRRSQGERIQHDGLLSIALAAIDSVIGQPGIPCGQTYAAELHRLRGELLLARDGLAAGEVAMACFETALALGQEQGALAWELRAEMSRVRLHTRQREQCAAELGESLAHLRALHARFTEGLAFHDLQEAAALIAQGSAPLGQGLETTRGRGVA